MRLKQNHNCVLDNFHEVLKEAYKQIMGKMVNWLIRKTGWVSGFSVLREKAPMQGTTNVSIEVVKN